MSVVLNYPVDVVCQRSPRKLVCLLITLIWLSVGWSRPAVALLQKTLTVIVKCK